MLNEITSLGIGEREALELIKVSKNIKRDVKLLKKDYPIQYLIGNVDFYGYNIVVNESVLIPRPETEYLVELTIKEINSRKISKPVILDICTGSGCIAISLKGKIKDSEVYASDKSIRALNVAKENFKNNKMKICYIKSDLFKNLPEYPSKYHVIISNPPYISKKESVGASVKNEPDMALYSKDDGLYHIKKIIIDGYNKLSNNGFISLEIGETQKDRLETFIKNNLQEVNYRFEKDLTNKVRYLFIFKNLNK